VIDFAEYHISPGIDILPERETRSWEGKIFPVKGFVREIRRSIDG